MHDTSRTNLYQKYIINKKGHIVGLKALVYAVVLSFGVNSNATESVATTDITPVTGAGMDAAEGERGNKTGGQL